MKKKNNVFTWVLLVAIGVVLVYTIMSVFDFSPKIPEISYGQMVEDFENNKVYGYYDNPNEYSVRNMGTLSKPKLVEYFVITMDTIYNIYGNNVPEEIQNVLISGKFSKVTIKRDL